MLCPCLDETNPPDWLLTALSLVCSIKVSLMHDYLLEKLAMDLGTRTVTKRMFMLLNTWLILTKSELACFIRQEISL